MEDKLRAHMDHLFREVPTTKKSVELKEEILQNLVDKYHDLLGEGKSEDAAYNIAVASIGDISELLESLKEGYVADNREMDEEYKKWKKQSAILTPVAVMLYIMCVIPPIVVDALHFNDAIGACGLFIFIAVATALLIYNNMSKPVAVKYNETMMDDFREWKTNQESKKRARKSINSALWAIIVVLYFAVSFTTGAWYITWVIFLIGAAAENIVKAYFELKD